MKSHQNRCISTHRQLDCLLNSLFVLKWQYQSSELSHLKGIHRSHGVGDPCHDVIVNGRSMTWCCMCMVYIGGHCTYRRAAVQHVWYTDVCKPRLLWPGECCCLTPWSLGYRSGILINNCHALLKHRCLQHFLWNCPWVIAAGPQVMAWSDVTSVGNNKSNDFIIHDVSTSRMEEKLQMTSL